MTMQPAPAMGQPAPGTMGQPQFQVIQPGVQFAPGGQAQFATYPQFATYNQQGQLVLQPAQFALPGMAGQPQGRQQEPEKGG